MNNPTPDEITAALAVLHRIPDTNPSISLSQIERLNRPIVRMARDLIGWAQDDGNDYRQNTPAAVAEMLENMAEEHGLRITTDPGELVGHTAVVPINSDGGWMLDHGVGTYGSDDLDSIRSLVSRSGHQRVVALHLLPEGGQS